VPGSPWTKAAAALVLLLAAGPALAQEPAYVRFTHAASQAVRGSVRLPGTMESRVASVVAGESAGLVTALEVQEGDHVERGQPLAYLRKSYYETQLRAAKGLLKEAQARLNLAESKLRRARELFADEIVSQEEVDDAYSEHTAWQGRDDQSRAEIERLELILEHCTIRAPFTGVVVRKRTDVGQWIALGGAVVEMVALRDLLMRVEMPERYFPLVAPGIEAAITFEALPGAPTRGLVERVIPSADPRARSFPVLIGVSNSDGRIGVGMLGEVALPVGATVEALVVPKDAVIRDGANEMLFRIKNDETVEAVPVVSGAGTGSWVTVEGPLDAGDRVVTRGNERLRPGQSVRPELLEYALP